MDNFNGVIQEFMSNALENSPEWRNPEIMEISIERDSALQKLKTLLNDEEGRSLAEQLKEQFEIELARISACAFEAGFKRGIQFNKYMSGE